MEFKEASKLDERCFQNWSLDFAVVEAYVKSTLRRYGTIEVKLDRRKKIGCLEHTLS